MGFPIYKLSSTFNFIFVFFIPKYDQKQYTTTAWQEIMKLTHFSQLCLDTGPFLSLLCIRH